ncbi:MAG: GDP-mannose 4,6-dehydratase [Deltaproteobacteria bacterium]|jgi:UDP-glucuronate 4-epimerase|nr:GDP-mannose 4,6-dehydratase [Deltaproteobacteria bacterium]
MSKKVLLTGAAGFIGNYTARELLKQGYEVTGVDNLNHYYDPQLKYYRLEQLRKLDNFNFYKLDIENQEALRVLFEIHKPDMVINLAARAGVGYSLENPHVYLSTNGAGTLNLLELMVEFDIEKMVLASTSSLYAGQKMPFSEKLPVNTPISPYAASKKAAEVMCYTYHFLYDLDISVVRYFTVFGPAGRPDMSIFRFIKWIDEGKDLILRGDGSQSRDFTYVEDIARGTVRAMEEKTGYEIINLGGGRNPRSLNEMIAFIEKTLGKKAKIKREPMPKEDMMSTWADIKKAHSLLGWKPEVSFEEGLSRTIEWHMKNRDWLKKVDPFLVEGSKKSG